MAVMPPVFRSHLSKCWPVSNQCQTRHFLNGPSSPGSYVLQCGVPYPLFRITTFSGGQIERQPCEMSMGRTVLNLDFCASRCNLLQCGSESYRCPPWAFPP